MAQAFGLDQIRSAEPYWYERQAYTATVNVAGNQIYNLFSVQGWEPSNQPTYQASLVDLGITQDPNIRLDITYDRSNLRAFADHFRPDLDPVEVNRWALNNLSVTLTNLSSSTSQSTQIVYTTSVWRMPIAVKLLLGYALSAQEQAIARAVGLDLSPVAQQGVFPIPLSAIIERTYANRQIRGPLEWSGPAQTPTTNPTAFLNVVANTNELLVLREIYAEADPDYGIRIQVDRDGAQNYLDLDASLLSRGGQGVDMFLPAKTSLAVKIVASQQPPGPTPVRVVVWHLSLSAILRVRLGLSTEADLQALYGNQVGLEVYQRIVAGVR
jgi:hypothetical protein